MVSLVVAPDPAVLAWWFGGLVVETSGRGWRMDVEGSLPGRNELGGRCERRCGDAPAALAEPGACEVAVDAASPHRFG